MHVFAYTTIGIDTNGLKQEAYRSIYQNDPVNFCR